MKKTITRVGLLVIPLLIVGCQQEAARNAPVRTSSPSGQSTAPPLAAAEKRDMALIRVVHAIPAGSTVDVFAGDNTVFDGIAYKTVTPYREIDGKRFTFHLRPAGMNQAEPLASATEGLSRGRYYTVFVTPGDGAAARLQVVADTHSIPATGKARVRVMHGSSDAGQFDVYEVGRADVLFDAVDFQAVTEYDDIDPFAGTLELRPEGESNVMLSIPNVRLDAGKTYTIVVIGRVRTAPKLETFVIEDQVMAPGR